MRGKGLWVGAAVLALASAGGGYWWFALPHATEAEAAALRSRFDAVLGPTAKALTIRPAGDHYDLTIAPETALAPLLKEMPGTVTVSPYRLRLTSEGKGLWQVDSDPQQLSIHVASGPAAGGMTLEYRIEGLRLSGRYSETLHFYTELDTDIAALEMRQTGPDGAKGMEQITVTQGPSHTHSAARAGAQGIDLTTSMKIGTLVETLTRPADAALGVSAPRPATSRVEIRIGAVQSEGKMTGLRWSEILTLVRRAMALQQDGTPMPDSAKPELAKLSIAALPVFDTASGRIDLNDMQIDADGQTFALSRGAIEVELSGLSPQGHFREAFEVEGLSLPDALRPDWGAPLIPTKARIDVSIADFDLQTPLRILFDELAKGGKAEGPGFEARMTAALLPAGGLTVALRPSQVSGQGYRFEAEAKAVVTPGLPAPKQFSAMLRLAGLDTILTALQKAPEDVRQGAMALMMARGFAKVDPDGALGWALSTTPEGILVVNGTQLGAVMGNKP